MSELVSRELLLHLFDGLRASFDRSLTAAQAVEKEFETSRAAFVGNITGHLKAAEKSLPRNHPIRGEVVAFLKEMDRTTTLWDEQIAGRDKGVKFRAHFEDSLLIFVNGKVKSGKSSLGNYMAWGNTDPTPEMKQGLPAKLTPRFFSHAKTAVKGGDASNEAEKRREFRVGATEATSSIQGFSLPGMTWVDSPGMHSLNVENENLARDYVEHADLILYTMKSDSPGRESDLKEIKALFVKDKAPLLLLTGSDDMEEDLAEDGDTLVQTVVMKSQERRARQRDYVRAALVEHCGDAVAAKVDIVSFSARYAQLHHDDKAAFTDSGMEQLCTTLYDLCKSEAVRIKQRTPMTNLSNFLQACRTDLQPYKSLIDAFRKPLDALKRESDSHLPVYVQRGQARLSLFIDDFFEQEGLNGSSADVVSEQLGRFQHALREHYKAVLTEQLGAIFEEIMDGFAHAVQDTYRNSELLQLPEFQVETATERVAAVRSGTRKRNSLLGAVLGGAVGFVLGGPVGAATGASLGGSLGGATGSAAGTDYREFQVTIGDNLQDIRRAALDNCTRMLDEAMRSGTRQLWALVEQDVDRILMQIAQEVAQFEQQLQRLTKKTQTIGKTS